MIQTFRRGAQTVPTLYNSAAKLLILDDQEELWIRISGFESLGRGQLRVLVFTLLAYLQKRGLKGGGRNLNQSGVRREELQN